MHMSTKILLDYRKITSHREMPESIESSRFVSRRARMSGEFDSRKDLQSTINKIQIFVELSFRELCDSKLSSLHVFDNMAITYYVQIGKK